MRKQSSPLTKTCREGTMGSRRAGVDFHLQGRTAQPLFGMGALPNVLSDGRRGIQVRRRNAIQGIH